MIGRINGIVVEKQAPHLLIEVHGVGYELQAPMTTFYHLPDLGKPVVLHTHFSVSENAQQLFGFANRRDRELFRLLIKVGGVGPKMAVGIMSMEADDFVRCVLENNITALVKVPGVGKKTAERLVIEMRDKLKDWSMPPIVATDSGAETLPSATQNSAIIAEAESALVALGYKPAEASRAIAKIFDDTMTRSEDLIRLALRNMLPS